MKENSIEENIEILEKFKNNEMQRDKLERDGRCGGWKIGDIYKCLELDNAIDNILSDYKRVLKENEKLKEDRDKFKKALRKRITYCNELEKDLFENCSKYVIPIQKIKDKIEEYKNMLKTCNKVKDIDRIKAINERILELQELLEGRR